ncbi:phosphotransferase [Flexivirga meconopsidis]|uniref:phosphotransferase n=1 Tax=Flexivirga meconopsidis TaxID=2977121 RepID=UPI0022403A06|nr:phosphotransferase [Flexivirga meconopsidis]
MPPAERPTPSLTTRQRELLDAWLPGYAVVADHTWGLDDRVVLEIAQSGRRFIVKAGGEAEKHIAREIHAHREWVPIWAVTGHAPKLVHADAAAKLLVTAHLPGRLVLDSPAQDDPECYRQAGRLLAQFHGQHQGIDDDYLATAHDRMVHWLDADHRIAPETVERLRDAMRDWPTGPAPVVPTHGDWQPRNWLVDGGQVRIIDFGRAELRPAATDFARLARQDVERSPALEQAFFEGYGVDPREPDAWRRMLLHEAVGSAVWAYQVGDEDFEAQGHRMIGQALDIA